MSYLTKTLSVILFITSISGPAFSQTPATPELVVHLLDYLAKDYGGAVQNGKVVSQGEYKEQVEFAQIISSTTEKIASLNGDTKFVTDVKQLNVIIESKGPADEVARLARQLQQTAIQLAKIETAPTTFPSLDQGAKLFQTNCTSCHGGAGHGDGIAGASLDPKPANFHDEELVLGSAPFKFYNTIRLGLPGTGMAAFSSLTDEEVWNLAFYLKALPYQGKPKKISAKEFSLKEVASLTDQEIAAKLAASDEDTKLFLASVRTESKPSGGDGLQVAETLLNESLKKSASSNFEEASSIAIRAYLEGIEPLEPKMKANIPGFVEQIEGLMSEYRSSLERKDPQEKLAAQVAGIVKKLDEARTSFAQQKMSSSVAFGAAFSIFLREGFEAVLLIVVLISILGAMGQSNAVRWVHIGWITAVMLGIVAWFGSGYVLAMSGMSRELLEGVIALLAVAVLLYIGFWLHRYSEIKKWRAYLEAKLRHGLNSGNYAILALVSFMAVFREAFEVVLFLRAIWMDLDTAGQTSAGLGIASSIVLLSGFAFLAVKQGKKLPLGLLFRVCSWTMIALAFILAGKGVHSLQEAGVLGVSTLPFNPRIDLVGVFPTFETVLAQVVLVFAFGVFLLLERRSKRVSVPVGE